MTLSNPLESALTIIRSKIDQARTLYHQLVLVVAPVRSGKTTLLTRLASEASFPLLNVNLELTKLLLDLPIKKRGLEAVRLLEQIIEARNAPVLILDNLEILFDPSLSLSPLACLQNLSRHRVIVAAWAGHLDDGCLIYAEPGHPEFRREPAADLLTVSLDSPTPVLT